MQSPVGLYDPFNPCEKNRTIILEGYAEVKGNIYRTFLAKTYGAPVSLCFVSEPSETVGGPKKYYLSVDKTKISITSGIIIEPKVNSATPVKTSVNVILISAKDGRNCYLRFADGEQFTQWRSVLSKALVEVLCHDALVPLYTGRLSSIRLKNCLFTCATLIEETDNPYVLQIRRIVAIKEDLARAMLTLQTNPRGLTKTEMQSILNAARSEPSLQSDPDLLFLTHLATLQGCAPSDVTNLCKELSQHKTTDHPLGCRGVIQPSTAGVESVKENLTSKFSLHTNNKHVHARAAATDAVKTPAGVATPAPAVTVSAAGLSPLRESVHFVPTTPNNDGISDVKVEYEGTNLTHLKRKKGLKRIQHKRENSPIKSARPSLKKNGELSPVPPERTAVVHFSPNTSAGSGPVASTPKSSIHSSGIKSSLAMSGGSASKHRRHISFRQEVSTSDGTPSRLAPIRCELSPKTPTSARKVAAANGLLNNTRSLTPMNDNQMKAIQALKIEKLALNYAMVMESMLDESTKTDPVPAAVASDKSSTSEPVAETTVPSVQKQPKSPKEKRASTSSGSSSKPSAKSPGRTSSGLMSPSAGVKIFDENVPPSGNTSTVSASGGNRAALSNLSASKVNSRAPSGAAGTTGLKPDLEKPHAGSMIKSALKSIAKVSVSELTIRGTEEFPYVEKDQEMVGCYKKMNKVLELLKPMDDEPPEVRFRSIMKTFNITFDAIKNTPGKTPSKSAHTPVAVSPVPAPAGLSVCEDSAAFLESLKHRKNSVSQEIPSKTETEPVVKIEEELVSSNPSALSSVLSSVSVSASLSSKLSIEVGNDVLTPKNSPSLSRPGSSRMSVQEGSCATPPSPRNEVLVQMQYCSPQVSMSFDNIMEDLNFEVVDDDEQDVADSEHDCGLMTSDEPEDSPGSEETESIELQSESSKATINRLAMLLLALYLVAGVIVAGLMFKSYNQQRAAQMTKPTLNLVKSKPILLLPPPPGYSDQIYLPEPKEDFSRLSKTDMMHRMTTGRYDESLLSHFFGETIFYESDATEYSDNYDFSQQWSSVLGTMTVKIVPRRSSLWGDLRDVGLSVMKDLKEEWIEEVESM